MTRPLRMPKTIPSLPNLAGTELNDVNPHLKKTISKHNHSHRRDGRGPAPRGLAPSLPSLVFRDVFLKGR